MTEQKAACRRDLFITKDMGNRITCIEDAANVMMYLVEGSHHALLIDTGTGIGNVNAFVKSLTKLPVYTVITHGHVDHAGGCYDFEEVYLSPKDEYLLPDTTNVEIRQAFAEKSAAMAKQMGMPEAQWKKQDFTAPHSVKILPLEDKMEFDLGGRIIIAVEVPGHTQGFMAFYDEQTASLFAGDCGNPSTFLFLRESTSLEEYRQSLLKLKEQYGDIMKHWFISHAMPEVPVSILGELIECCDAVVEGRADGPHFEFDFADMGNEDAYFVYPVDDNQLRTDGHWGNIVYDRKRIHKQ